MEIDDMQQSLELLENIKYFFYNPSIIPTPCTTNATIHAVAHCISAIPAAALTVPISLRTVAIAATQGV